MGDEVMTSCASIITLQNYIMTELRNSLKGGESV
jgi:hypothetical protein